MHLAGIEGGMAHIPVKRLLAVAVEDLIFTMEDCPATTMKSCLSAFSRKYP